MVELARLPEGSKRGISIRMFKDHAPPHFHAVKDNRSAMIDIRTMEVKKTSLTNKQEKLVLNWVRGREQALLKAWDDLQAGRTPDRLDR